MERDGAAEKGRGGALTPGENPAGGEAEQLREMVADLARTGQPGLPGLDDPADDLDLLGRAAERVNAERRGRGRPAGSANLRNAEVFDYLEARGFKAPELRLMEIVSADARALAVAMSGPGAVAETVPFERILEVVRLQAKVAVELMPYKFAKRQELKVQHDHRSLHVFMAGPLVQPGQGQVAGFSLDGGLSNEINEADVRQPDKSSHVPREAEQYQKDSVSKPTDRKTAD